ncbi:uncharacterized protein LOC143659472 [Tamandua tetradactyla]|uniref:uncharacterized protein LOC143659472 n=1 Tax=Tamandua tetradactyla TaxID=48850 RepID=UPI00405406C1
MPLLGDKILEQWSPGIPREPTVTCIKVESLSDRDGILSGSPTKVLLTRTSSTSPFSDVPQQLDMQCVINAERSSGLCITTGPTEMMAKTFKKCKPTRTKKGGEKMTSAKKDQ